MHWYSWTGTFKRHWIFSTQQVQYMQPTVIFQLGCKSLFLKEQFLLQRLGHVRSNKSRKLSYEKKQASFDGYIKNERQSAVMLHLLYSPVAKFVPELSILFYFLMLFSAQQKGDLDCLKAWRSVLLQSSWSPLQTALTCREAGLESMAECTGDALKVW